MNSDSPHSNNEDFAAINEESFKSCFARSVAVNSQRKNSVNLDGERDKENFEIDSPIIRFRNKNNRSLSLDETRRFSYNGNLIQKRRSEIPVQNICNQNKIETLEWQIKEIEKSREMYKAVLKQIVTFLEKAYVSLEHLGTRLNTKNPKNHDFFDDLSDTYSVSSKRSLAEEHFNTWHTTKKTPNNTKEIPPQKLSQEAYRLFRTAQSLLNTEEPKLAGSRINFEPEDSEFLQQLAKEFPVRPETQKGSKSVVPDDDEEISTEFKRKFSLQFNNEHRPSKSNEFKLKPGSVSSIEDESGFSSLNSFQDVGLPLFNSSALEDHVSTRSVLLKSMLHNNTSETLIQNSNFSTKSDEKPEKNTDDTPLFRFNSDVKLWQKPSNCSGSGEVLSENWPLSRDKPIEDNQSIKVHWV